SHDEPFPIGKVFQTQGSYIDALIIKAHTIDERVNFGQPEHAGLVVPWLGARRDGTNFHESETECSHLLKIFGILIKTCCESDGILKPQTKHFALKSRMMIGKGGTHHTFCAPHTKKISKAAGDSIMGRFRVH